MTPGDAARVLTKAAAFDQRTIGEADVRAWHEALADVDGADALAAVSRHYADSDQRIMPVHVRRLCAAIDRERRSAQRRAELEPQRLALQAEAAQDRGPLTDRRPEIRAFVASVRGVLPEGSEEALKPRAAAWQREHHAHQRAASAEPNPDYDPTMQPIPEWSASQTAPAGAWWEDPEKRERHARALLREAGRLNPKEA